MKPRGGQHPLRVKFLFPDWLSLHSSYVKGMWTGCDWHVSEPVSPPKGKRHRSGGVLICLLYVYCSELGGVIWQVFSVCVVLIPGLGKPI